MPKLVKIDVTKIDKARLFKGAKGTYLDLVLVDNKDGTDQYGNDGFVTQSATKEEREQGIKMPILGNWRELGQKPQAKPAPKPATKPKATEPDDENPVDDDVPF